MGLPGGALAQQRGDAFPMMTHTGTGGASYYAGNPTKDLPRSWGGSPLTADQQAWLRQVAEMKELGERKWKS